MIHRDGSIIDANYSKSCGGICEAPEPVWGVTKPGQVVGVSSEGNNVPLHVCHFLFGCGVEYA